MEQFVTGGGGMKMRSSSKITQRDSDPNTLVMSRHTRAYHALTDVITRHQHHHGPLHAKSNATCDGIRPCTPAISSKALFPKPLLLVITSCAHLLSSSRFTHATSFSARAL
jgi:hypothetical protein